MLKVLLVEDENLIRRGLQYKMDWTEVNCVVVGEAATGQEGLTQIKALRPDIVITDIRMPDMDGLDVLSQLSGLPQEVPVIIISAMGQVQDRIRGLKMGADDYLVKPFSFEELMARVRALTRRSAPTLAPFYTLCDLTLDPNSHTVTRAGREIKLSAKEFKCLCYLLAHAGQVITREHIINDVWGYEYAGEVRMVDTVITRLRRKLFPDAKRKLHFDISTVFGVGYKLEEKR